MKLNSKSGLSGGGNPLNTFKSITLSVHHEFNASHSLEGFEAPHVHLFKIVLEFEATLPFQSDKVVDLVQMQKNLACVCAPYTNVYLNETFAFSPTSENLAMAIAIDWAKNYPSVPLSGVRVKLCDLEGRVSGEVRLSS